MDHENSDLTKGEDAPFNFDVADDALERAANPANGAAVSYMHCTFPWYYCDYPQ